MRVAPRLTANHKQARERLQALVNSQPTIRKSFRRSSLYNAVTLAIKRELVERLKAPFVLTIRGASTETPELLQLEVRLTSEARRAHTAATIAAPSGYYTKIKTTL